MQNIAKGDGDLNRSLNDPSNDELGMLAKAFDDFITKIHGLVRNVDQSMQSGLEAVNITVNGIHQLAREVDNATEVLITLELESDNIGR